MGSLFLRTTPTILLIFPKVNRLQDQKLLSNRVWTVMTAEHWEMEAGEWKKACSLLRDIYQEPEL